MIMKKLKIFFRNTKEIFCKHKTILRKKISKILSYCTTQNTIKNMFKNHFKSSFRKTALIVPAFFLLIGLFMFSNSYTKIFVYIDGQKIGSVQNVDESEKIINDYLEFSNANFGTDAQNKISLRSELSFSEPSLNNQNLRDNVNKLISEEFVNAYALYIDDVFILATPNINDIKNNIAQIEKEVSTLLKSNATIYNNIEIKNTFYPTEKITNKKDVYKKITGIDKITKSNIKKSTLLNSTRTPIKIYSINKILFETYEYYKVERTITPAIKYVNDNTLYKGCEYIAVAGQEGIVIDTYKKTMFEGEEQYTELITSSTITPPINKIIKVGTKEIDSDKPKMFIFPLSTNNYFLSSLYGQRDLNKDGVNEYHSGMDWGVTVGNDVLACNSGIVTLAKENHGNAGTTIIIQHENGLKTQYMHLSKILVKEGQKVTGGEVIGLSGNTGRSTGPHLHLSVYDKNGNILNPLHYFIDSQKALKK